MEKPAALLNTDLPIVITDFADVFRAFLELNNDDLLDMLTDPDTDPIHLEVETLQVQP